MIRLDPKGDSPADSMLRECARTGYRAGNDGCTLHASVHCAAACAFTILGTVAAAASGGRPLEPIVRLVDGRPQAVVVPPATAQGSAGQSACWPIGVVRIQLKKKHSK